MLIIPCDPGLVNAFDKLAQPVGNSMGAVSAFISKVFVLLIFFTLLFSVWVCSKHAN